MTFTSTQAKTNITVVTEPKVRNRATYFCALLLVAYMVFYFYYQLFVSSSDGEPDFLIVLCSFFCNIIFGLVILKQIKSIPNYIAILFCLYFISYILSYLIVRSGFHKILLLTLFLLAAYLFVVYPLNKNDMKKLFWIYCCAVIIILLNTSVTGKEEGKFNSNTGGLLVTLVYCAALILFLMSNKRQRNRWSYLIICFISVILQFLYNSRTALLGLILFTAMVLILHGKRRTFKAKFVAFAVLVFACMGILFAYLYAEILPKIISDSNITIFGKKLFSGREWIWNYTFESIRNNFFWGAGGRLNEEYVELNKVVAEVHNQHLGILAEGGIFVFVLFYLTFSSIMFFAYNHKSKYIINRMPAIYVAVIMLMCFFEAYLTSPYNVLAIIIVLAIIVSCSSKQRFKNS